MTTAPLQTAQRGISALEILHGTHASPALTRAHLPRGVNFVLVEQLHHHLLQLNARRAKAAYSKCIAHNAFPVTILTIIVPTASASIVPTLLALRASVETLSQRLESMWPVGTYSKFVAQVIIVPVTLWSTPAVREHTPVQILRRSVIFAVLALSDGVKLVLARVKPTSHVLTVVRTRLASVVKARAPRARPTSARMDPSPLVFHAGLADSAKDLCRGAL